MCFKVGMGKFGWIVVIFLLIGTYMVYDNLKIDLSKPTDIVTLVGAVTAWAADVGNSLYEVGKTTAEQQWLPDNSTYTVKD